MKVTLQLPETVGKELLRLPDLEAFVSLTLMKALEERQQTTQSPPAGSQRGRWLDPSEEQALNLPPKKNRDRELAWRRAHQEDLQKNFPGQWVVLEGEQIVASSQDAARAVQEARSKGISLPFLFYVEPSRPNVVQLGL